MQRGYVRQTIHIQGMTEQNYIIFHHATQNGT